MGLRTDVVLWSGGLFAALCLTVLVSATVGPVTLGLEAVTRASLNAVGVPTGLSIETATTGIPGARLPIPAVSYTYPFDFAVADNAETIVRQLRLPRIALAAVVGFALATAGTVMQGFFRNPMADPSIIGVSSGAAVGAVATIALPLSLPLGLQGAASWPRSAST